MFSIFCEFIFSEVWYVLLGKERTRNWCFFFKDMETRAVLKAPSPITSKIKLHCPLGCTRISMSSSWIKSLDFCSFCVFSMIFLSALEFVLLNSFTYFTIACRFAGLIRPGLMGENGALTVSLELIQT